MNQVNQANQANQVKTHSLQDPFLNHLRRQRVPVAVYLTNGIKLQGQVSAFDQYVLLLKNQTKQMVYKHAIATIVPSRNVVWNDIEADALEEEMEEF